MGEFSMSRMNGSLARGRASLLAGSMFATTALAGLGGLVGSVVLSPGSALAIVICLPDAPNTTGGAALVNPAGGVETCTPATNITGLGDEANGPANSNLTVTSTSPGAPGGGPSGNVTTRGVFVGDNGSNAANVSFLVNTTTTAGPNITNTT